MPSSTSSSERLVAPMPERELPALRTGVVLLVALLTAAGGVATWESYWRAWGAEPAIANSDGLWARERRRIDEGEGARTVLLGDSRMLFDVDLDTFERAAGERPIQLAIEGTSPMPILEDLADDPDFTGRAIVGLAPDVFFTGFEYRGGVLKQYRDETPSERSGQWLSMRALEPHLAFMDPDFALFTVLKRQAWPVRAKVPSYIDVRRLSVSDEDRDTEMWSKVEDDVAYRDLARSVWKQWLTLPPAKDDAEREKQRAEFAKLIDTQIARAVAATVKLRARGAKVVFVRPPSNGDYHAFEQLAFPREKTWDVLIARTGAPGVHFEDHADQQELELPEWSHLSARDAERYTEALVRALDALPSSGGAAANSAR